MRLVDSSAIADFLNALGARQREPQQLSLLGGCALILLGSTRSTADIDYVGDDIRQTAFQHTISQVAAQLQLDVEPVPIDRFVPLPLDSEARRIVVARYGTVDVYIVDPYVMALSKLDRAFDTDPDSPSSQSMISQLSSNGAMPSPPASVCPNSLLTPSLIYGVV